MDSFFLIQQVFSTLSTTYNKLLANSDEVFQTITTKQFMTLLSILHLKEGEASYNAVAKMMGTTKQNIKQIITALEKKQLVRIEKHATDKRAVNITVTSLGKQAMLEPKEQCLAFFEQLSSGFTEEELMTLWKLLIRLYEYDGQKFHGFEERVSVEIPKKGES